MVCFRRQKWREKVLMRYYRCLSEEAPGAGKLWRKGCPNQPGAESGREVREGFPEEVVIELGALDYKDVCTVSGVGKVILVRGKGKTPFWELELFRAVVRTWYGKEGLGGNGDRENR